MNDSGSVIIGRMGSFQFNLFEGVMWVDGLGWTKMGEFFRQQGVAGPTSSAWTTPSPSTARATRWSAACSACR